VNHVLVGDAVLAGTAGNLHPDRLPCHVGRVKETCHTGLGGGGHQPESDGLRETR
jgi:hypothetical protein